MEKKAGSSPSAPRVALGRSVDGRGRFFLLKSAVFLHSADRQHVEEKHRLTCGEGHVVHERPVAELKAGLDLPAPLATGHLDAPLHWRLPVSDTSRRDDIIGPGMTPAEVFQGILMM